MQSRAALATIVAFVSVIAAWKTNSNLQSCAAHADTVAPAYFAAALRKLNSCSPSVSPYTTVFAIRFAIRNIQDLQSIAVIASTAVLASLGANVSQHEENQNYNGVKTSLVLD